MLQEPGSDVVLGSGAYRYRFVYDWAKLPHGYSLGDVGSIAVDKQDNVFVFNRSDHPMIVFDQRGNFLFSWGEGVFKNPHGAHIGPDDNIYCTDDGDHTVRKCTPEGKVLRIYGVPLQPAEKMSGRPFHGCTHTASSPEDDLYVADGYGNARVHKYGSGGKYIESWGESGTDPGQFNVPHNICCDAAGRVYVADRENHRVQIFDGDGRYQAQWNNLHRPNGLYMRSGADALCYIAEGSANLKVNAGFPNLGARVSIVTKQGESRGRVGDAYMGVGPGQFLAPHGIAVDSRGDIYVGEVAHTAYPVRYPGKDVPADLRTFQKLVKVT